jgi:hypothetical protein
MAETIAKEHTVENESTIRTRLASRGSQFKESLSSAAGGLGSRYIDHVRENTRGGRILFGDSAADREHKETNRELARLRLERQQFLNENMGGDYTATQERLDKQDIARDEATAEQRRLREQAIADRPGEEKRQKLQMDAYELQLKAAQTAADNAPGDRLKQEAADKLQKNINTLRLEIEQFKKKNMAADQHHVELGRASDLARRAGDAFLEQYTTGSDTASMMIKALIQEGGYKIPDGDFQKYLKSDPQLQQLAADYSLLQVNDRRGKGTPAEQELQEGVWQAGLRQFGYSELPGGMIMTPTGRRFTQDEAIQDIMGRMADHAEASMKRSAWKKAAQGEVKSVLVEGLIASDWAMVNAVKEADALYKAYPQEVQDRADAWGLLRQLADTPEGTDTYEATGMKLKELAEDIGVEVSDDGRYVRDDKIPAAHGPGFDEDGGGWLLLSDYKDRLGKSNAIIAAVTGRVESEAQRKEDQKPVAGLMVKQQGEDWIAFDPATGTVAWRVDSRSLSRTFANLDTDPKLKPLKQAYSIWRAETTLLDDSTEFPYGASSSTKKIFAMFLHNTSWTLPGDAAGADSDIAGTGLEDEVQPGGLHPRKNMDGRFGVDYFFPDPNKVVEEPESGSAEEPESGSAEESTSLIGLDEGISQGTDKVTLLRRERFKLGESTAGDVIARLQKKLSIDGYLNKLNALAATGHAIKSGKPAYIKAISNDPIMKTNTPPAIISRLLLIEKLNQEKPSKSELAKLSPKHQKHYRTVRARLFDK